MEVPVRQPDFSPGSLPPEWYNAIRKAQAQTPTESPVAREPSGSAPHPAGAPDVHGHSQELRALVGQLKRERIARGLSLSDVAGVSQQARSAIHRLQNRQKSHPTINTLFRYAQALGIRITFLAEPFPCAERGGDMKEDPDRG